VKSDLEYACESYFIELYRTSSALKGKAIRHFDEDRPAESNCVIVQAIQGNFLTSDSTGDNPGDNVPPVLRTATGAAIDAYEVEVTVEYRSTSKTSLRHNSLSIAALGDAIKNATKGQTTVENDFGYLLIRSTASGNRDNTKNLRTVQRKFNLIAVLKE
jgi:hypothetical protein